MQADHFRIVVGNFESEMVDIKKGSFLRIWDWNQNVCTEAPQNRGSPQLFGPSSVQFEGKMRSF